MPILPDKMLKDLAEANAEAKATVQELHQARKELIDVQKKERNRVTNLLTEEVSAQVRILADKAYQEMIEKANDILERIEKDWREKLGLDK